MKNKLALFLAVVFCLVLFAGCGGASSTTTEKESTPKEPVKKQKEELPIDLEIADFNYTLVDGYLHYVIAIHNPNTNYRSDYTNVVVTGTANDGSIRFNDEWVVGSCWPGSTTYWANQAGDGDIVSDDKIEVAVSVNKDGWVASDKTVPEDLYTFENVTAKPEEFEGIKVTGKITLSEDVDSIEKEVGNTFFQGFNNPMLVCVLKDADGKLIGGFPGYMNSELNPGAPSAFDISSYYDSPEYATVEMYANPW